MLFSQFEFKGERQMSKLPGCLVWNSEGEFCLKKTCICFINIVMSHICIKKKEEENEERRAAWLAHYSP